MDHSLDQQVDADRARCLQRILDSGADKKLIVAGPGTGKTFTFEKVIRQLPDRPLVLTFLTLLVRDLEDSLGDQADVYSFHAYAKWVLHSQAAAGVTTAVKYYPPLVLLQAEDIRILHAANLHHCDVEALFRNLAEDDLTNTALASGSYYDAVGHDDSVYRALHTLQADGSKIRAYPQILVDEFQDFSPLEVAFIHVLSTRSPTLIVGDDDQALYAFRDASPDDIRELYASDHYENFELPYCSRCTEVLVASTHTVVERAQQQGLLAGRINKRYTCYSPGKREESAAYPQIIHARCSVQGNKTPYMGRYIAGRIRGIPDRDIERSREGGHPTVLIIGPNPFLGQVKDWVENAFTQVESRDRSELQLDVEYAYRLIGRHRSSRLGWRILAQLRMPPDWEGAVHRALSTYEELIDLLPADFVEEELEVAQLITRLLENGDLSESEWQRLATALGESVHVVHSRFRGEGEPDKEVTEPVDEPRIVLTSLIGAKGLQAEHVFIVGANEQHFPRENADPTNVEVCQLLVALTRARQSCTIVSATRLGGQQLGRSRFVDWLDPHTDEVYVNKEYLEAYGM